MNSNPAPAGPVSFVDSLAGKLVLFFLLPFLIFTGLAIGLFFFIRRRRSRRVKLASEHHQRQFSQCSSADFKFPNSESHWSEEPKSSRYSTHSEPSEADLVFVSYEEAKGQRMSEHWNKSASSPPSNWNHEEEIASLSPRSGRSGMSRSPPMELRSLPQSIRGSLMPNASIFEDTAGASGSEQYHGGDEESSDAQSTRGTALAPSTPGPYPYPASRRETTGTLPAYTVDDENETPPASAIRTTPGNTFDSAAAEKLQLQLAYSGCTTPQSGTASPTSPVAGPSRPPTQAQKRMTHTSGAYSITSMFAAPPSDGRQSIPPTPHPPPHSNLPSLPLPRPPSRFTLSRKHVPGVPTSPRISELPYDGSPNSTKVQPKTSISPEDQLNKATLPAPSAFQDLQAEEGSGGGHARNRSLGGMSYKTTASAARPDSLIMPFEDFVTSLDHSGSSTDDDDLFGSRK
jgi:hypothetical protein